MLLNVLIGCGLIVFTTFVHAGAMAVSLRMLQISRAGYWARKSAWTLPVAVAALVIVMFVAAIIEAMAWALSYLALGAVTDAAEAFYFSMVTYTTLGYGDVVLQDWRVLSTFQAANGVIMFGWTTALIFAAVHHVYLRRTHTVDAE